MRISQLIFQSNSPSGECHRHIFRFTKITDHFSSHRNFLNEWSPPPSVSKNVLAGLGPLKKMKVGRKRLSLIFHHARIVEITFTHFLLHALCPRRSSPSSHSLWGGGDAFWAIFFLTPCFSAMGHRSPYANDSDYVFFIKRIHSPPSADLNMAFQGKD